MLADGLRLPRVLSLFDNDLVDALPRYLEVLSQPRLIPLRQAVPLQQIPDGDAKFLCALRIPLGHSLPVSVSSSRAGCALRRALRTPSGIGIRWFRPESPALFDNDLVDALP